MADLKLCKCGAVPGAYRVGDNKQYFVFRCPKCGYIAAKNDEARITIWGAKRVWNKRIKDGDDGG